MGITNQTREITHDTSTTTTVLACSKPPVHVIGLVGCFANHGDNSVVKGGDNTNSNAQGQSLQFYMLCIWEKNMVK